MSARGSLAAAGLALALAGCCATPPRSQFPGPAEALERLKATYACANGVQGTAKIDRFSPQGRLRGEVYVFGVNPARVRFDVASPFGQMLYTLTSNGREFRMLDVKEKKLFFGPPSACNLARLTQVPVPGEVLVALLRGEAPLVAHRPEDASIGWDCDGGYRVEIAGAHDAREQLWLEPYDGDFDLPWQRQRLRVGRVRIAQRGAVLYEVELGRHEPAHTAPPRVDPDGLGEDIPPSGGACDIEVPRAIRIVFPGTGDDVVLQYERVAVNPPIPEGAFSQPVPAGAKRTFVACE
ncbi:MAG: hypothetical protein HY744_08345 [Deltaproteobacteria bacterium]|nr:hypothetical protein [Deltaproteobacteria bacterium]